MAGEIFLMLLVHDIFSLSKKYHGAERDRTADLMLAKHALSQLSYCPEILVGPSGFEPLTPVLSGLCSNQLSYGPMHITHTETST